MINVFAYLNPAHAKAVNANVPNIHRVRLIRTTKGEVFYSLLWGIIGAVVGAIVLTILVKGMIPSSTVTFDHLSGECLRVLSQDPRHNCRNLPTKFSSIKGRKLSFRSP